MQYKRKNWELGFEKFFKDAKKGEIQFAPLPEWVIEEPVPKIEFATREDYERTVAMIDFCTKYEKESFELFYKWFKKNEGKED